MQLIDGGSTWNNNMMTAIDQCMKLEGITQEEQVEVDYIVLHQDKTPGPYDDEHVDSNRTSIDLDLMPDTIRNYFRQKEIKDYYQSVDDLVEQMRTNPRIQYRYYFAPQKPLLKSYQILEFGYDWTHPMVVQGQAEAKDVIAMGPGKSFDDLLAKHKQLHPEEYVE